jgi:hypothetical protein
MDESKPTIDTAVSSVRRRNKRLHLIEKGKASQWLPRYSVEEACERAGLP